MQRCLGRVAAQTKRACKTARHAIGHLTAQETSWYHRKSEHALVPGVILSNEAVGSVGLAACRPPRDEAATYAISYIPNQSNTHRLRGVVPEKPRVVLREAKDRMGRVRAHEQGQRRCRCAQNLTTGSWGLQNRRGCHGLVNSSNIVSASLRKCILVIAKMHTRSQKRINKTIPSVGWQGDVGRNVAKRRRKPSMLAASPDAALKPRPTAAEQLAASS